MLQSTCTSRYLAFIALAIALSIALALARPTTSGFGPASSRLWFAQTGRLQGLECSLCKDFVRLARSALDAGESSYVPEIARIVCLIKYKEADQVCDGVVNLWRPIFKFAIDKVYLSPDNVCGQYIGEECSNSTIPELNYYWNVTLPIPKPPVKPVGPPKPGSRRLKVAHISDVHVDVLYRVGASADCGLPTCCRLSDGDPSTSKRKAEYWGDYNCDLPWWSLDRIFDQLNRTEKFDAIYFTGDLPDHHVWEQTRAQQVDIYRNFTALIRKYFPGVPFVAALGNHESVPVNSFPPRYIKGNDSMDWYYPALCQFLSPWVPADQKANVLKGGYYTQLLYPGFRVVSLNLNYGNNLNWWILQNITDPDDQLQWLIGVLQRAEDNNEKVHILGHIPSSELIKGYSWNYFTIAKRYESTITGHFFGHTHHDELGVYFDPTNTTRAFATAYIVGSLKTDDNPSYRVYDVDGGYTNASWQVLDYYNYIFNLTEANQAGRSRDPDWVLEYQPTKDYGLSYTYPSQWAALIDRFEQSDDLFQKYYRFYHKSNLPDNAPSCTGDCKRHFICRMRNMRSGDDVIPC